MIDSPTERITSSPTFLISQLSDPSFVSSICRPFAKGEIRPDSFSFSLAEKVLIPNVIRNINERNLEAMKNIPTLTKLLVDNLGYEGLQLIMQNIVPALQNSLKATSSTSSREMMKLFGDTICSISSKYRDDVFVEVISKNSSETEAKLRILAAYLIPLVRDPTRVLCHFRSLSLDRVTQVRCELIKGLQNCTFEESLLQYILINASKDQNLTVRRAAATVYGKVAPQRYEEFLPLLTDQETVKSALRSMKEIVMENGLTPLAGAFHKACYLEPELSAAVVLNISRVVPEDEKTMVLNFAHLLKLTNNIIQHLFKFSEIFPEKEFFVDMLEPDTKQSWRTRKTLLEQAILFVPVLHDKLSKVAEKFSHDPTAIIRNMSVSLWVALIRDNESLVVDAKRLIQDENWQTRLVLGKIVNEIGIDPFFEDVAEQLSKDEVSNVRFCIASKVAHTDYFEKLFGTCEDKDILQLRQ